jgi:hypothetical protein
MNKTLVVPIAKRVCAKNEKVKTYLKVPQALNTFMIPLRNLLFS